MYFTPNVYGQEIHRLDAIVGMMPYPQKGQRRKPNMIKIQALLRLLCLHGERILVTQVKRLSNLMQPTLFTILKLSTVSTVGLTRI
jgi:hypothetical protein